MMPGSKGLNSRELALYNVVIKIKNIQISHKNKNNTNRLRSSEGLYCFYFLNKSKKV